MVCFKLKAFISYYLKTNFLSMTTSFTTLPYNNI